jgi:protein required for attachment to host cells
VTDTAIANSGGRTWDFAKSRVSNAKASDKADGRAIPVRRHGRAATKDRTGRVRSSSPRRLGAVDISLAAISFRFRSKCRPSRANARGEFDRSILVAPAHALGELNHALDASKQGKIAAQLQKDLTNVPTADLAKHFTDPSPI